MAPPPAGLERPEVTPEVGSFPTSYFRLHLPQQEDPREKGWLCASGVARPRCVPQPSMSCPRGDADGFTQGNRGFERIPGGQEVLYFKIEYLLCALPRPHPSFELLDQIRTSLCRGCYDIDSDPSLILCFLLQDSATVSAFVKRSNSTYLLLLS